MPLLNHNPLRTHGTDDYVVDFQFDTNNASNPSSTTIKPNYGTDLAVAYGGSAGTFTATFVGSKKPLRVRGTAHIMGDEPNLSAKVSAYDSSTGVVTVKVYSNSAGTITATNTTGKTVVVVLFCSKNSRSL
jgi:hypothetical protein